MSPANRLVHIVAERFGVPVPELLSGRRNQPTALARQTVYFALAHRARRPMSTLTIGRVMSRDPSTVSHGIAKVKSRAAVDPAFADLVADIVGRAP